jgi:lysyl-tRNA synthetase class 2
VNPETRELFVKKAHFWKSARSFLEEHGFFEVDTPALEEIPGGADARPFITHHNALDRDFYLRISLELPLKKVIIGGFEKIYEIGRVFRNEGISTEHLQDYLECEFYWAYADYQDMMGLVENMYRRLTEETTRGVETRYEDHTVRWSGEWERADFHELIQSKLGVDLSKFEEGKLLEWGKKHELRIEEWWGRGRIIDYIWKKKVRPQIAGPLLLLHHPMDVSPLAKERIEKPGTVERFQVIVAGTEVGNGWSELNDPLEQARRFDEQEVLRRRGDEEAQRKDESFIEALEYGMPPTAGFGFSERLFSVLVGRPIRETVLFPPMKKKND